MKLLVISDSHGSYEKMYTLFKSGNYRGVIFLGDGLRDAERLYDDSYGVPVYRVAGNCDFSLGNTLLEQIIEIGGKKILITHGHKYSVKNGYHLLFEIAKKRQVDMALCGHTHVQYYEKRDNVIVANPGALMLGKYAVLTIDKDITFKMGDIYD